MVRNRVRLVLVVVLLFAGGLVWSTPAGATPQSGRWYNPPIVVSDGAHDANVQDGAYYWQDRGFPGFYPPLPRVIGGWRCDTPYDGEIMVCEVPRWVVEQYSCMYGGSCDGTAGAVSRNFYDYSYTPARIIRAYILIDNGLSPWDRQIAYRHEFGHVLGLGSEYGYPHTSNPECIMYYAPWSPGLSCEEDIESMQGLYHNPPHW